MDLDLYPGEVHTLMGMNGGGKSTLVQILSGAHHPDGGTIQVNGATYAGLTVRRAPGLGIASVPQRREPATGLTVAENVMLGDLPTRRGMVHWKAVNSEARKALSDRLPERRGGAPFCPGERGAAVSVRRAEKGVPVAAKVWRELT
ncbi:ATP-binding cassette domain-containing protein [Streptomyces mirabilis]|uniref:ATP-binding cassette domain-containing protein n=1 Tax=Streptomyces mirabilis TaxID=68239 RepID=UPI00368960E5